MSEDKGRAVIPHRSGGAGQTEPDSGHMQIAMGTANMRQKKARKEELEGLLVVGARVKLGEQYCQLHRGTNAGDIITLVEGEFEEENGLYGYTSTAPSVWDEQMKEFDSIYHLFGNDLEDFMDCEVLPAVEQPYQSRVAGWMQSCFGPVIAADTQERNHRFLEEALELVQSCGATAEECHQLVDYVFSRAVGEPHQESGGVSVTHAALCLANGLDMQQCAETELARILRPAIMEKIRAKQAAKPAIGPLPGVYPDREPLKQERPV